MGILSWAGAKKRQLTTAASTTTAAAVAAAALLYPGFTETHLELNDGGIWVTNTSKNAVGRLNFASKTLDGAVLAASSDFDVLQHEGTVLMQDAGASAANRVDPAEVRLGGEQGLPAGAELSLGTDTAAVADPSAGKVWVFPQSTLPGVDLENQPPLVEGGKGSAAAVGPTDTVAVADPEKGLVTTITPGGSREERGFTELAGAKQAQVAVVGDRPVAYDPAHGRLFLPNGQTVEVPGGKGGRLQHNGEAADTVAIAVPSGLVLQPLDGGTARTVAASTAGAEGVPAAPVRVNGCVYGAWSGSAAYVRDCNGDTSRRQIPQASERSAFVFRVNRNLVVLNDTSAGTVWLVSEDMMIVNNWDEVVPVQTSSVDAEKESPDTIQSAQLPDRTKPNSPPVAKEDRFGVRPGRTTLLPVLENDSDPDGDVLTVAAESRPAAGTLEEVYGGTGFQVTLPADARGADSFSYTADDGRGLTASASVALEIVPPDVNRAPQLKPGRNNPLIVGVGKEATREVLPDWSDPDGDDLFLVSASPRAAP